MSDTRKCLACGESKFSIRSFLMSTTGATLVGLDWLNPSATAYICENCGYIMLYAQVAPKQNEQHIDSVILEEERTRAIASFVKRDKAI